MKNIHTYYLKIVLLTFVTGSMVAMDQEGLNLSTSSRCPEAEQNIVSMWGAKKITMTPQDSRPKSISTFGLGGCIATAVQVTCKSKSQFAFLAHNPPTDKMSHLNKVQKALQEGISFCREGRSSADNEESVEKINVVNSVPGEWVKNPKNNSWSMEPEKGMYDQILDCIKSCPKAYAQENGIPLSAVSVRSAGYSRMIMCEIEKSTKPHDFELVLDPNPDKSLYYEKGSYHIPHSLNK